MSDNAFLRLDGLKAALSRVKTKVDSDIASAISESTISLTSLISSGDSSTLTNAKSYIDGIKTNLDSTIASNLATAKGYTDGAKTALETNITNHKNDTSNPHNVTAAQVGAAASSHTHTESDITDLGSYASSTDLNSYGVSGLSFNDSTSVLTLTMKDNSTKTATITGVSGSGSSSVTLQDLGGASATDLSNHTSNTSNPHSVTYTQVGAAAASHTHVESDITDLGNYANASHTHTVSDLTDASTELAAKNHTHTESDITDLGNYSVTGHSHTVSDITDASTELASKSHTHTESDITDLGDYATNANLNSYGVKSISFNSSTGVLTLTMKDDSTKTVTIQASSSGSGSSSGSSITISSASYDDTTNNIVFTMSDNSTVNCSLNDLLDQVLTFEEGLKTFEYNSDWEDQMTGTGTELDPYLIYTPKDFTKINEDMSAHYKLMNNLDFSELTGLSIQLDETNNTFTLTTTDNSAELYNSGEGYRPIGYDGYYPLNGSTKSTSVFSELSNIGSIPVIYGSSATSQYYVFTGELDGNSKVIKGIISSPANAYSVGLFSFLGNGAKIHNLTIKDSVFIVNDVYAGYAYSYNLMSGVGSVTGNITYIDDNTNNRVNIYNIYSYATLISNRTASSGSVSLGGIYAKIQGDSYPGCLVNQCAFRGKFMILNPQNHRVRGIGSYSNYGDSTNRITNCINTATLKNGSYTEGIGQNLGKVNINCGLIQKYTGEAYSLSSHANTGYVNGKQFSIRDNLQYDTRTSESSNNSYNYYFKTATEIKSRDFITEANNLSGSKVFIYNNLGIDNNWPLLVDEYKQYIDYDLDLDLAIVDKTNNKVYSSGLTINDMSTVGHSHTANDITDASSTFAAKSHTHTTSEITNFGNYANASHTHTESDITNLGNYATNTDLNSYGVKSISYTSNILTLTMKDNSTKTVTIQASGESGSSGSENTSIGVNISSATYNTDYKSIEFIMSDNSIINCSLIELIKSIINNDENLTIAPLIYNSEWVDRITGTGTEEDPYLIYTPKDFMSINNDMDGHYKLMNNLDFSNLCGLSVETDDENNSFTITTEDSSAVMYNNGEGYFPIGYDGYYPLNGTEKSTSLFSELANINNTSKIYGTSATSQYYCFTGELDGNSKVIKGIISNPANTYSVGLFSFLANKANIHNLIIKDSVFILNDIYCTSNKNSGIGSVTGCITYIDSNTNNRVNISNVYSYSTLISNKSTSGYCSIAGIYSRVTSNNNNGDNAPGCLVNQCAFRGKMMVINPTVSHHVVGIGHYANWSDSVNRITNCINTATLKNGLNYTQGIGQNLGKVNINCGLLEKYGGEAYSLSGHANTGYVNGKQFTIRDNLSRDNRTSESNNNSYNYYFKTIEEIKSESFISEANSLCDSPAFIVNDLNFDNGWPLLIDEYNQLEKYTNKKTSNNLNKNLVYDSNLTNVTIDYNSEWVDRITGTGTEEDPYLIYTPKDFMSINNDMDGHYKLMNNLDFSNLCGIDIQANKSAESYSVNITDDSAPLYNNGEGYFPIGYNGFYPAPYVTDDNHPNGYYTPGGDPGPITWEEINEIEQWNYSPSTSNIRGSMSASNYLQYCFTGELDGNSKVIKGIRCKPASAFSVGLFMFLSKNASIHNLMLIDSIFVLSDVWHQWPNNTNRECYIGAIAGDLCKGNISGSYTVNIYNVYSYATLINDFRSGSSYQGSFTGGLIGDNGAQTTVNFKFNQCTNRGIIIRTNKLDAHIISGIITSQNRGSSQMIMNCINSSNFTAKWAIGLGYTYADKININFGTINTYANTTSWQTLLAVGGESERTSSTYSYYNEKTPYVMYSSSTPRFYAKSEEFLKSQEFIDEANTNNREELLIYNDLNFDNGWPLLVDEYNLIKKFIDPLKITAIDVNTNKLYSSTISPNNIAEKHHSHVVNDITNFDSYFNTRLSTLKCISLIIETSEWTVEEDNGTATGNYLATKTVTGITGTSPVQMISQLGSEIQINSISTDSVTFIATSQPDSNINVSIMFT